MTEQRHAGLGIHAAPTTGSGDDHPEHLQRLKVVRGLKIVTIVVLVLLGVGAARTPPKWLKPGDKVEVEIERIGILATSVISEPSVG